ncbi:MAG TPA: energy transducer TonB [Sphingomicrobium sp.]|nr:energy transducer TonB [Sphingomicrobium sp.]
MLAYAADKPRSASRAGSPKALALIIAGHAALIAAVMTARMDVSAIIPTDPTDLINVPIDPPPPEPRPRTLPQREQRAQSAFIDRPTTIVDMDATTASSFAQGPTIDDIASVIGTDVSFKLDPPKPAPVRVAARFATSAGALKPPYPNDKLRAEEEATLKLRLTIDARGRVSAVDPVGTADPSFLQAARRHIMKAWRYKPATEDGVAVPSSTVISLSFRLEEV